MEKAAALEAMKLVHLNVQGFALEGLFLAEVIIDFFHRETLLWFKWIFQLHLIAEFLISLWKSVMQLPFYFAFSRNLPLVSSSRLSSPLEKPAQTFAEGLGLPAHLEHPKLRAPAAKSTTHVHWGSSPHCYFKFHFLFLL